ncbi:aminoglycoside phosphotransferase family protein [Amycolatopsis sp. NPDC059027]|uniref:aminoglycoside phosphotransferase family protein n=1 Tax=Amycolatopsis sp. NPDC059027 TaxID=3346709 RepID=UPI00366A85F3
MLDELAAGAYFGLCHGDPSPWNILQAAGGQWMLIDPRGICGEVEYGAALMALKISGAVPSLPDVAGLIAEAAKLDPKRARAWEIVARAGRV